METTADILKKARERDERIANEAPRIDYVLAKKLHTKHKSALSRAKNVKDPAKRKNAVVKACRAAVLDWNSKDIPWPDQWSMWQIALDDVLPPGERVTLESLGHV